MADAGIPAGKSPGDEEADVLDRLDPIVLHHSVRGLKFSAALPERLATATVAARLADFESARSVLGELVRFQHDG
ncbi:hypothetical protein [Streptomyces massasporeus]|uniref:hypothetical protein n=1 Tax=Streptomyces massasporeus TaxID=67324 RepID=UPI00167A1377|nr:hypothetical protein [Streptomyces massasporeus]GGV66246.1 hypothetical protein GCM10010228_18720 [Streptomyces massasporeus]